MTELAPEGLAFLNSLAPPDPRWPGRGAVRLLPDVRDRSMHWLPRVRDMLVLGTPATFDLSRSVRRVYNQGAEPSCVAFSSCAMKDLEDSIDRGGGPEYAGHVLYRDCGGDGSSGIDSRAALEEMRSKGTPVLSGGYGNKIASYAFAPQVAGQFRDTLKAAIAAGKPCVIAMLLPSNFGWSSSGSLTSGYHQQVLVGYDDTWAIILNNWGSGWGNGGFDRVAWDFIEQQGLQHSYAFAYTIEDAGAPTPTPTPTPEPTPTPDPPPPPGERAIAGVATGANLQALAVGQTLAVASEPAIGFSGNLQITQIKGGPTPTPTPAPTPTPTPTPTPGLSIAHTARRYSTGQVVIWAQLQDAGGRPVPGQISGTAGSQVLPTQRVGGGRVAVWSVSAVGAGARVALNGTADGGAGSSAAFTV